MLRFANPSSDIGGFTRTYQALFEELQANQPFILDDISAALVRRRLVTSSGYASDEALRRSTRPDRSRDPIYNQSKMYSELFRLLGWIHPTPDSQLSFELTWLGAHIASAGHYAKSLVRECVLGIAFPNSVVATKGNYQLRPFALILRTIDALGGILCRDEMIIGPLSLQDDTDIAAVQLMFNSIKALRCRNPKKLDNAVLSTAKQSNIKINTLENYTRFPLAVLEWSGWTEKIRDKNLYGKSIIFHKITDAGLKQIEIINKSKDFRASLLLSDMKARHAIAKLGAISMLERAGFDSSNIFQERQKWADYLTETGIIPSANTTIFFSPFQELPPIESSLIFGKLGKNFSQPHERTQIETTPSVGRGLVLATTIRLLKRTKSANLEHCENFDPIEKLIFENLSHVGTSDIVVNHMMEIIKNSNKSEFYPAIAFIFRLLGYDCSISRSGVNYQRWDAFITHSHDSVPIEIKSPGEEQYISVKGIRQALENKIILLSRKMAPCRRETTSLVVGYLPPNNRAEVADLISDIYGAFNINIGVIDFRSLVVLAIAALRGEQHDANTLLTLKGFINVETA